jgi:hypothetical protein
MKYPEGVEEDIVVRPGMPSVGPESKSKASHKEGPLFLERERREEFFVLGQMRW